ncbi:MAG: hypothetical protein ACFB14_20730 [Leptolyngbyaceae cyanobacterium]
MTTTFTEYRVTPGQRWDSIAYATLNDPYGYQVIIENNPIYRDVIVFNSAISLRIPVLEETAQVDPQLLPPWRR